MSSPYRVVVVDPAEIVLQGVSCILSSEAGYEVVAEEQDGRQGLERVLELLPDLVLTETELPGLHGVDLVTRVHDEQPQVRCLALSDCQDPKIVRAMLEAGAAGYVVKHDEHAELVRALAAIKNGRFYISPAIADVMVRTSGKDGVAIVDPVFDRLSSREREVLKLLGDGFTSKEIAGKLHVSSKTIDAHRQNVMRKLQTDNQADLVKHAIQSGLTRAEPGSA